MKYFNRNNKKVSDSVLGMAKAARAGKMDRREFLSLASALGATTATAFAMAGLPMPAHAQSVTPVKGGTLRNATSVLQPKDPRTFDWTQMGNIARTFLEPLVSYEPDATFKPMLLASWEVNEDASEYILHVRQGVTWTTGETFTADDVVFNLERWCDKTVEGNSMAARMASLIDEDTGKARAGAITKVDDYTVKLVPAQSDITLIPGMSDYPGRRLCGPSRRHRRVRAGVLRGWRSRGGQAPRVRPMVGWRGASGQHRIHRHGHRPGDFGCGV